MESIYPTLDLRLVHVICIAPQGVKQILFHYSFEMCLCSGVISSDVSAAAMRRNYTDTPLVEEVEKHA